MFVFGLRHLFLLNLLLFGLSPGGNNYATAFTFGTYKGCFLPGMLCSYSCQEAKPLGGWGLVLIFHLE